MMEELNYGPLIESDADCVQKWLADWLTRHVSGWSGAYGLDWTTNDIKAHIERQALVGREWAEIRAAAADRDCFVCVAKAGRTPVGLVYAEKRTDRYLALTTGVISWIYVDPSVRQKGVALRLLEEAHGWFVQQDVSVSEVFVTASNRAALAAYERGGYRVLDHRLLAVMRDPSSE